MLKTDSPALVEKALRAYADSLRLKINEHISDDYFCQLSYEALDADKLADEINKSE